MRNPLNQTHTSSWKEYVWNSESPMSKIWEIKEILEPTEWDNYKVKIIKSNLFQLIRNWNYITFQKKIGMPDKQCDWLLWTTSLDYLIQYIVWIEDWGESNIVWETVKYIWNIFKYGKISPDEIAEPKNRMSTPVSPHIPINDPSLHARQTKENISSNHMFLDTPIWNIVSHPTIKNEDTESYCCSKTARLNGLHFWISLPRWNAYNAWILPTTWIIEIIPKEKSWKKPNRSRIAIEEWEFNLVNPSANFADIYAESSSSYGHRAIAIRDTEWKRYILDPYIRINGKKSLKPIKLKDYITKWRKILKAHFYHSNWYIN